MAFTYGFYNSVNHDRMYDAEQFGRIFDGLIEDGIYQNYGKSMMVKASTNLNEVIVQPGRAWFNHTWSYNDSDLQMPAPEPDLVLDRIDALVLDINQELDKRENTIVWVEGTPASRDPQKPVMVNDTTHHQYPLCYVHRRASVSIIETKDIENAVGTSATPFVTGIISSMNIDDLIAQWKAAFLSWSDASRQQFLNWFANLQYVLDGDVAGHLQNEIDNIIETLSASGISYSNAVSDLAATDVQGAIDEVADQMSYNGTKIYMQMKDGRWGYNTSSARGADTFHPFKNLDDIKRYLPTSFGISVSGSGSPHNCGGNSSTSIISPANGTLSLTFSEGARETSPSDGFRQYANASATCHSVTLSLSSDGAHSGTLRIYENETITLSIRAGNIDRSQHGCTMGLTWNFD